MVNISNKTIAANSFTVATDEGGLVQSYTVNDILEMIPEHHIDLFKIDIEGAERFISSDESPSWIQHVGIVLVELHDCKQEGCTREYHAALSRFDYSEFAGAGRIGTLLQPSGFSERAGSNLSSGFEWEAKPGT